MRMGSKSHRAFLLLGLVPWIGCHPESAQHQVTVAADSSGSRDTPPANDKSAPESHAESVALSSDFVASVAGERTKGDDPSETSRARPAEGEGMAIGEAVAPPASATPPRVLVRPDSALEEGCKRARPGDRHWDYPDRIRAAGVKLKGSPPTALRGYLFWTSPTDACLRVDARTPGSESFARQAARAQSSGPPLLELTLQFDSGPLEPVAEPLFGFESPAYRFEDVEPDHVYSISLHVHCPTQSRNECRSVGVFVKFPSELVYSRIGIDLKDGG